MTVALIVTPGLRDHVERHDQARQELRLTCMRGRQLTQLSTTVHPGELYRATGHTIEAPEGDWLIDGVGLEAVGQGYTLRTWPHDPVRLIGPSWKRDGDVIHYTFELEMVAR